MEGTIWHQWTSGYSLHHRSAKEIDISVAGMASPSPLGGRLGESPGAVKSVMPGQELFSVVEWGSIGQLMGRTDNVMGRRLPLDLGSLWLWTQSAGGAAPSFSGMLWYLLEKHQKNRH